MQVQYGNDGHPSRVPPHVVYAHLKFLWTAHEGSEETLRYLFKFTASLARDFVPEQERSVSSAKQGKMEELSRLLARCYFKQGQWQVALHKDWDTVRFYISLFQAA